MELKFRVAARIAKPVHGVFEAVVDPAQLSEYFTTGGAQGRLEAGATVTWDFHDFPGVFPVYVIDVVQDEKIVLEWQASEGEAPNVADGELAEADYRTRVTTASPRSTTVGRWSRSPRRAGAKIRARWARAMAIARAGRRCCAR